jgi:hypothetical protein
MRSTAPLALKTVGGSSSWKTQYRPRESTFTDIGFPFSEPTPSSVPRVASVRTEMVQRGQAGSSGTTLGAWAAAICAPNAVATSARLMLCVM